MKGFQFQDKGNSKEEIISFSVSYSPTCVFAFAPLGVIAMAETNVKKLFVVFSRRFTSSDLIVKSLLCFEFISCMM